MAPARFHCQIISFYDKCSILNKEIKKKTFAKKTIVLLTINYSQPLIEIVVSLKRECLE